MTGFLRDRMSHRSSKGLRMELLEVRCYEACFGIDGSSARDLPIDAKTPTAFYFYVEHLAKSDEAEIL